MRPIIAVLLLAAAAAWAQDTCLECHEALEGDLQAPAKAFANDIHRERGFGCADCHGGDPTAMDPEEAMSPAKGFRGAIRRRRIPELCARCHSNPGLMHRYDPQQRVDQLAQYRTSVHGKRLAAGDENVATCVDCHSVHDIRKVKDPLSPVYPLRIVVTCARCHADEKLMAKYNLWATQPEDYKASVHWKALAERGDLSAPSCASCHGNHGATPPQVSSVAAVCGLCHVLQEQFFDKSPHYEAFTELGLSGCVVCHGNHRIEHPTDKMLSIEGGVCGKCHEAGTPAAEIAGRIQGLLQRLSGEMERARAILDEARTAGIEVSEAEIQLVQARDNLLKARVTVHSFDVEAVRKDIDEGLKMAATAYEAGVDALKERDRRRLGLVFSLVAIAVTIIGLWLAIRSREQQTAAPTDAGRG